MTNAEEKGLLIYPVIISYIPNKTGHDYLVYVPDFDINTSGDNFLDAVFMARDAISMTAIDMQDDGEALPRPSKTVKHQPKEIVTYVDINLPQYRKEHETGTVKKSVSIPKYLVTAGENRDLNFSAVLTEALHERLKM